MLPPQPTVVIINVTIYKNHKYTSCLLLPYSHWRIRPFHLDHLMSHHLHLRPLPNLQSCLCKFMTISGTSSPVYHCATIFKAPKLSHVLHTRRNSWKHHKMCSKSRQDGRKHQNTCEFTFERGLVLNTSCSNKYCVQLLSLCGGEHICMLAHERVKCCFHSP